MPEPNIVVYGAPWCEACKGAKAWLVSKRVAFTEKNIDLDADEAELAAKLKAAGLGRVGIPVLDLGGKLHVGFDPKKPLKLPEAAAVPAKQPPAEESMLDYRHAAVAGMGVLGGATVGYWAFDHLLGKDIRPQEKRQLGAFAITMGILGVATQLGYEKWLTGEALLEKVK
jgi:glutaredoxin